MKRLFLPKLKNINIIEVGPRDGLQNEKKVLSIHERFNIIQKCQSIGLKHIEIGSFISPKLLPQVSNTFELLQKLNTKKDNTYSILIPHIKYLKFIDFKNENDIKQLKKINELVLFVAASETFNKKNINTSSIEAFNRFKDIIQFVKYFNLKYDTNIKIRGSISTCMKCPFEGIIPIDNVLHIINQYFNLNINLSYIDIADTIGEATPEQTHLLISKIKEYYPIELFSGHFHNTNNNNNLAIENVEACIQNGITTFHSSIGGLGGCPFSNKRVGNLATEKLVSYLDKKGYTTGINLEECKEIGKWIQSKFH